MQASAGEDLASANRMTKLRAAVQCGGDLNRVNQAIQHYMDVQSKLPRRLCRRLFKTVEMWCRLGCVAENPVD